MSDLVSVIIPSYKGEDKICRAVDSVLAQTYENIEVFVVDDNGKGTEHQLKTAEVMQKYENNKKVIFTYIHEKTTPIHEDEKGMIYQDDSNAHNNYRKYLTKPTNELERYIVSFFAKDKIFYSGNPCSGTYKRFASKTFRNCKDNQGIQSRST